MALSDREDVVLAAVARHPDELFYASHRLRNCRTFVLSAVLVNGLCIEWATPELRRDDEIAAAAVRQNEQAIMHLYDDTIRSLQKSNRISVSSVSKYGWMRKRGVFN